MKLLAIALLAACGGTTNSSTGTTTDGPDAGVTTTTDGSTTPPPDGAVTPTASIQVISATVKDERADTVHFDTGEPIHDHTGPGVFVGGSACNDVYLYGYLMDAAAPVYGGELQPNPLAWKLAVTGGTAEYRVRTDDGVQLLDWTAMSGDTIALHRNAIPKLGTRDGGMVMDVRVGDAMQTFCWKHHPLAAPVELKAVAPAATGETLAQLHVGGPLSDLLQAQATVPSVYTEELVQYVAEPITLGLTVTKPTGTFTKISASWYAKTASGTLSCGTTDVPSDDPRCQMTAFANQLTPANGALTTGSWSIKLVDETSGSPVCTVAGLSATCTIPPRAVGAPAHAYLLTVSVDAVTNLWPAAAGPFAEYTVLGRAYTGLPATTFQHCDARSTQVVGATVKISCAYSTYAHLYAVDQATLSLAPASVAFLASVSADVPLAAIGYATAQQSAPFAWNSGVATLPGQ